MKSLFAIVKNLSEKEIKSFRRLFLSSNKRGENKKGILFNALLKSSCPDEFRQFIKTQGYSRQNYYQLSKRLRENLYDFLFSFHTIKHSDIPFSNEMECHKKLYSVKVLLDRNMEEEAKLILDGILLMAERNGLSAISIEATALRNKYFPLEDFPPNYNINKDSFESLRRDVDQHEYFKLYLEESIRSNHISDIDLRRALLLNMKQLNGKSSDSLDRFHQINTLFFQKNYEAAFSFIKRWVSSISVKEKNDSTITLGLLQVEWVKACICLGQYQAAHRILLKAEASLGALGYWQALLQELKFVVALRTGEVKEQADALHKVHQLPFMQAHGEVKARWTLYLAWHYYQNKSFKKVIKIANSKEHGFHSGQRHLILLKMLELMSISQLYDPDWFYYKAESLRKQFHAKASKMDRLQKLFVILKKSLGHNARREVFLQKLKKLEQVNPWHPLSIEMVNISRLITALMEPTGRGHERETPLTTASELYMS